MSKRKAPVWVKVLMLVFLLYSAVKITNLRTQIEEKREELISLSMRVEEYEEANNQLRQEMQNGTTEEDISEIARMELGYAKPGERIFEDTSSR